MILKVTFDEGFSWCPLYDTDYEDREVEVTEAEAEEIRAAFDEMYRVQRLISNRVK